VMGAKLCDCILWEKLFSSKKNKFSNYSSILKLVSHHILGDIQDTVMQWLFVKTLGFF
jgi:hypothetical protein